MPAMSAGLFSLEFFRRARRKGSAARGAPARAVEARLLLGHVGAGGSTREGTLRRCSIRAEAGRRAASRASAARASRAGSRAVPGHGIRHLVALRGDLRPARGGGRFRYASELVAFIRRNGDWFHIDVAAYPEYHPQAKSPQEDLAAFKQKIAAGADSAITQYFYNADAYWHFVDACGAAGIDVPIVPGIMPIGSAAKLARFSDACGAEIPRWIRKRLEGYGDDTASIRAFGLDVVTELCDGLLARGAPGLHFYTLNVASLTTTIWQRLGL
jgi:methylenetetrahydrofolate reductase (NADPH)